MKGEFDALDRLFLNHMSEYLPIAHPSYLQLLAHDLRVLQ